ncbi:MAG: Flp pilus assembly complex ATPase component TadA [Deltaproteobacteria bacterium]|nr:Flp pilus assembly complex ATPase component TadA [Deltaproteobacteria bacterium]
MTRFINIMGVKDGVGASSFALKLALGLKKQGVRVLLLDWHPEYVGDLGRLSSSQNGWRTLRDLQKIPEPVDKNWLHGFLKNSDGVDSLSWGKARSELSNFTPRSAFSLLEPLLVHFDYVVADIGSRWNPFITPLLEKSFCLLFVLQAHSNLVQELRCKADELIQNYFPLEKTGWVAWNWDAQSFLTNKTVSDFSKISCRGSSVEEVIEALQKQEDRIDSAISSPSSVEQVISGEDTNSLKIALLRSVQEEMEAKGLKAEKEDKELRPKISKIILEVMAAKSHTFPESLDKTALLEELLSELLGLGPLEKLISNSGYSEILVNGAGTIYVEEKGKLRLTPLKFLNADSLQKTIERILLPVGRRVDESSPMVDARLHDGSRVNIILSPLALNGPVISIRRFSKELLGPKNLIQMGAASEETFAFLEEAVRTRKNILVSGGTGSGKTTLLNVLSSFIPETERIITIEDAAELQLRQPHVVRLESRPSNIEGKGSITIRDLVRNALRMRPDRIVIGECRGGEALDMLQAMNTGHEGSLTTLHANAPRDALNRLETLVMFSGMELPSKVIREQIASAIDLIIQVSRLSGGERKITQISKITGLEGDVFLLEDIFGGLA